LSAESIKQIANETFKTKGVVYDNATGFYYDTETGLYYDQAKQLFFDNENQIYYHYVLNKYTNTYLLRYHSKIRTKRRKEDRAVEMESDSTDDEMMNENACFNLGLDHQANKYPPCIRVIIDKVVYSSSNNFKRGSLFIIPYTGGVIGDSSKGMPKENNLNYVIDFKHEKNIDSVHSKVEYDMSEKSYFITGIFIDHLELVLKLYKLHF
jgi:hypothetical protein